jgi:hypothetical protein
VYSAISRLSLNRLLAMFDHPDANITADRRVETTTPLQKMSVLNSPFMVQQATALAERLDAEIPDDDPAVTTGRIQSAYVLLYARPATDEELRLGLNYLLAGDDPASRWQQYAHVLLAANELLYVD